MLIYTIQSFVTLSDQWTSRASDAPDDEEAAMGATRKRCGVRLVMAIAVTALVAG